MWRGRGPPNRARQLARGVRRPARVFRLRCRRGRGRNGVLPQDGERVGRPQVLQNAEDGPALLESLAHQAQDVRRLRSLSQRGLQLPALARGQGSIRTGGHVGIDRVQTGNGERKTGSSHGKASKGKGSDTPRAASKSATPAAGTGRAVGTAHPAAYPSA